MPAPKHRPSRAKRPRSQESYSIYVDTFDVERLMEKVQDSVSPIALGMFLGDYVKPELIKDIVNRFFSRGDSKTGKWPWLADATQAIRESMGFNPIGPINIRTDELFKFVADEGGGRVTPEPGGATLEFPGPPPSQALEDKLRHAQEGAFDNPIPQFGPTPPRPVLGADESDLAAILEMLQRHVILYVALNY